MSLVHDDQSTWLLTGLIDTGADSLLASNLLADQLNLDLDDHDGEATHAVGGRVVKARYKTIGLRLHPSNANESEYIQWEAQAVAVEERGAFDDRFGIVEAA